MSEEFLEKVGEHEKQICESKTERWKKASKQLKSQANIHMVDEEGNDEYDSNVETEIN